MFETEIMQLIQSVLKIYSTVFFPLKYIAYLELIRNA